MRTLEHDLECQGSRCYGHTCQALDSGDFISNTLHIRTTDPDCDAVAQGWSNDLVVYPQHNIWGNFQSMSALKHGDGHLFDAAFVMKCPDKFLI